MSITETKRAVSKGRKKTALQLLPYKERLKRYHEEKDKFFRENQSKSAEFLAKGHQKLIEKWGI